MMASNLSFNRSIAPSPALLTGFDSAHPDRASKPVILQSLKGRGAFLNSYLDKSGKVSKDFDPSKPNIIEGDVANLPKDCDAFRMDFSVNISAGSIRPNTCELPLVNQLITTISKTYVERGGYHFLAERYVWRLMSGAMMWRNYTVASDKQVTISFEYGDESHVLRSHCRDLPKTKYPGHAALRDAVPEIDVLIDAFAKALYDEDGDPLILHVAATGVVGYGGEVYPSQVFTENRATANGKPLSRKELVAYDLGDGRRQGKINATKIGNAIRHIDEWHGDASSGAIAIEAYGFVQHNLSALRPRDGANFYNILWQDSPAFPEQIKKAKRVSDIPADIHYFIAMLIRGGVFVAPGGGSEDE
jgi:CRISPR-associated protein Csy3